MTRPAAAARPTSHREQEILDVLRREGGAARIHTIAGALRVTDETVRRNIRRLAGDGVVEKVHGGARLVGAEREGSFWQRMNENPGAKRRIAAQVAALIPDGSSLFLDIGSTTAYIAEALRDHRRLLVITNSVVAASRLATRNDNRVFMAGGELRAHDGGAFGADAMEFVNRFQADFAILSAAAISPGAGILLFDLDEARFSRTIMTRAGTRIVAADASKFTRSAPIAVCDPSLIDVLVTDRRPPAALEAAARAWSTRIVLAGAD